MIRPVGKSDPAATIPLNGSHRWYACYTRSRHEKRVAERLRQRGHTVFLPLVERVRQWHDRKKRVPWPLFPSYVFARFELSTLSHILGTPGVASIVRQAGEPAPLTDEEIENVKRFADQISEAGVVPELTAYVEEGQRVRVTDGALKGVEGLVVERRGRDRALVQIGLKTIGQGLKVDLHVASLKAIGEIGSLSPAV